MHVEAEDNRPPSMLTLDAFNTPMMIGGVLIAILAHVVLPIAAVVAMGILAATGAATTEPDTYIEERVVAARFVQLGKKRDPRKLPDRIVPRQSTRPDKATVVSKNPDPVKPPKEKEKEPDDPIEDDIMRLGDRAKAFAEIAEEREREGDPNGVEWGTETEAQPGDIYVGQLVAFFKRGWTVPNTIGDTSKLKAVAEVEITRDLKVGPSRILQSSGVPLFDESVEERFQQLRTLGTTLPEPPLEVANQFLGRKLNVEFIGKR